MFEVLKNSGRARRGKLTTVHGVVETPAFMNVGTQGAIKGAVSTIDLVESHCQVQLSNTYHLHLRPGDDVIRKMGGLHKFINWDKPILTDSGGFQVFSLSKLRTIQEEGVFFNAHTDGHKVFMGPEESMRIQSNLASTIAMAFDECVENPAPIEYVEKSCARTLRWLYRCKLEMEKLSREPDTINKKQMLFGINQGGIYPDLRKKHMTDIAALDLDGYAIGGLAVGESAEEMYSIIDCVEPLMPINKPRYLMGVGTPINILEAVKRGIDIFDCVMPSRNARHGHLFTSGGIINIINQKHQLDENPIDLNCACSTCANFSRSYLRHLFKAGEMLAMRLAVIHNLFFYNHLMEEIRNSIENNCFEIYFEKQIQVLGKRI